MGLIPFLSPISIVQQNMGGGFSSFNKKELRILMLGLDSAGKTTILYNIKTNDEINTLPTVGFNVETIKYKNILLNLWDVGGQDKIRPLWRHYYTGSQGLIFVLDCADRDRIDEARLELARILENKEMAGAPLLVFANKQDQKYAVKATEVPSLLGLDKMVNRAWFVQPSCAKERKGLDPGLNWLIQNTASKKKKTKRK